jgi:hypothetical protein
LVDVFLVPLGRSLRQMEVQIVHIKEGLVDDQGILSGHLVGLEAHEPWLDLVGIFGDASPQILQPIHPAYDPFFNRQLRGNLNRLTRVWSAIVVLDVAEEVVAHGRINVLVGERLPDSLWHMCAPH